MTKDVKKKAKTEISTLDEFWGDFQTEYKNFVEWTYDKETGNKFAIVSFIEDKPSKYTNKWNREQWKILVQDDYNEEVILSGGKRLFNAIRKTCVENECLPTELEPIIIWRIGSGFDTKYKIEDVAK